MNHLIQNNARAAPKRSPGKITQLEAMSPVFAIPVNSMQ